MAQATRATVAERTDLSWAEVGQLAKVYLRIPIVLVLVEVAYRLITLPANTLALIQVVEAWLWHQTNVLLYGAGSSEFGLHDGWYTKVTLLHDRFPPFLGQPAVPLYVSDECAGIHEMVFFATLIMLTPGVSRRMRIRSILAVSGVIFVLNLVRLVVLYPIAVNSCASDPNALGCEDDLWRFHYFILEWGSPLFLLGAWAAWFLFVGGPDRVAGASQAAATGEVRRIGLRWPMPVPGWITLGVAGVLLIVMLATTDIAAIREISDKVNSCAEAVVWDSSCEDYEQRWDELTTRSWSLGMLSALLVGAALVRMDTQRPDGAEERVATQRSSEAGVPTDAPLKRPAADEEA